MLHYAIELFEGMKAYRGVDNRIRIFRPDMNMARMNRWERVSKMTLEIFRVLPSNKNLFML